MSGGAAGGERVLAGRYRLLRAVATRSRSTLWRGHDEVLERAVAVRTVEGARGSAELDALLQAAAAAARIVHPRVTATYDAALEDDLAYVVTEWVDGAPLAALLRDGPLSGPRATTLVAQCAEALSHAHSLGIAHGRLDAHDVLVCADGGVKVADFVLGALLDERTGRDGVETPSPGADVRALGGVLYAALTARTATGAETELTQAPTRNGVVLQPRQVRAGVSRELDEVTTRILWPERTPRRAPLRTADEVLRALSSLPGDTGLGERASSTARPEPQAPARVRRRSPWWLRFGVPTVVVALLGATSLALGQRVGELPPPEQPFQPLAPTDAPASAALGVPARPVSVRAFDPPPGDGRENDRAVPLATDGDPSTAWETSRYLDSPKFGGLKKGAGLLFDLGAVVDITRVELAFAQEGVDVELRVADVVGPDADSFRLVQTVRDVKRRERVVPGSGVSRGRYWLLWVTELVEVEGGFRGGVAEVAFVR